MRRAYATDRGTMTENLAGTELFWPQPTLAAVAANPALVGLLTSEPCKRHGLLAAATRSLESPRQWLLEGACALPLGYSGGAVPALHRSSLFVGRKNKVRPTTNAHTKTNV